MIHNEGFLWGLGKVFEGFCAFFVRFQLCFPLRGKVLIKPSPQKSAQKLGKNLLNIRRNTFDFEQKYLMKVKQSFQFLNNSILELNLPYFSLKPSEKWKYFL